MFYLMGKAGQLLFGRGGGGEEIADNDLARSGLICPECGGYKKKKVIVGWTSII